jgi:Asp/Glu/hydantoin racemase
MAKTLAVLHTSMVFITVETLIQKIFEELLPDVRLINIVDDSLLPDVMTRGEITTNVVKRMCSYAVAAETAGADAVFSACSSLGPTIDVARQLVSIPIVKIDDAMTAKAVEESTRVGVLATVPTTLGPTVDLIHEKAAVMKKDVEVRRGLVEGAFEKLMAGERDQHDAMVADSARRLAKTVDLLVLAQASMTRLAESLSSDTGLPVLSSPRLGIEHVKRVLNEGV